MGTAHPSSARCIGIISPAGIQDRHLLLSAPGTALQDERFLQPVPRVLQNPISRHDGSLLPSWRRISMLSRNRVLPYPCAPPAPDYGSPPSLSPRALGPNSAHACIEVTTGRGSSDSKAPEVDLRQNYPHLSPPRYPCGAPLVRTQRPSPHPLNLGVPVTQFELQNPWRLGLKRPCRLHLLMDQENKP